ncbi:MAG: hypothetical protein ACLQDL_07745 [Spirochaetia bacterium]
MKGRLVVVRDILILLAVVALLALAALAIERLLAPRPAVPPDIAAGLDESLGSLRRGQVLATQKVIDVPAVQEAFAVIAGRLHDALPALVPALPLR